MERIRNNCCLDIKSETANDELDEQKCTQKIGTLPGPTKKWRIKRIDELDDDELDEFYCICHRKFVRNPQNISLLRNGLILWHYFGYYKNFWSRHSTGFNCSTNSFFWRDPSTSIINFGSINQPEKKA